MLALLFEVLPKPGHEDHYFRHVAMLKPALERHDGLVWLDRFRSLQRKDVILSHQLWESEADIARWRADNQHRGSQQAGREKHFADYRIRVAQLLVRIARDGPPQTWTAASGGGGFVVVAHGEDGAVDGPGEEFASVNVAGAHALVADAGSEEDARAMLEDVAASEAVSWAFAAQVVRDYGMFDRAQVPSD